MLQRSQSTTQSPDGIILLISLAVLLILSAGSKTMSNASASDSSGVTLTLVEKRKNGSLLSRDKQLSILKEELYIESLSDGDALVFVRDLTRSQVVSIRSDDYRWTFKEVNVGLRIPRFGDVTIYYEDSLMIFEVTMQVSDLFDLLGDFSIGEKIAPPIILMEVS